MSEASAGKLAAPALIVTRAFLLFCSGIVTSVFAGHLTRKAEEALIAVRERDFFGKYLLHERISAQRWLGVLIVCVGVTLVWLSRR